jgi:UDP-N-acetylmuramoylalanine--D-glutamate ligase
VAAKQRILSLQPPAAAAVLNTGDAEVARWTPLVRGRLLAPLPDDQFPPLGVPGSHNRLNAACAAAAAVAIGCSPQAIDRGLREFAGLEQRLELVATVANRRLINDSSATTPESTIEALRSLPKPIWLLTGGSDKGADLEPMLAAIAEHAHGAACYGAVGQVLQRRLASHIQSTFTPRLADALAWCWQRSQPGDTIVLSPGFASHDQFTNYRQRGAAFVALVEQLRRRFANA